MTTSTTKLFPRYTGPMYGDTPVVKLANNKKEPSSFVHESSLREYNSPFWLDNPASLVETYDLLPQDSMTDAERLNAMTRAVIVIAAIMFLIQFELWWVFLVVGLIFVIALWQFSKERNRAFEASSQREYLRRPIIIKPINPIIQPLSRSSPPLNIIARNNN